MEKTLLFPMTNLVPGDRVITKSGKVGTVKPPPFEGMILFTMIAFDSGSESWVKTELLKLYEQPVATPVKRKKRRRTI
jgi:hypothetical protein